MSGVISGGGGDVTQAGTNNFIGTNTFNDFRPTSTASGSQDDDEFITKEKADDEYTPVFLQVSYVQMGSGTQGVQTVTRGVPTSSAPNQFGGVVNGYSPTGGFGSPLKPILTLLRNNSSVIIDVDLNGEWQDGGDVRFKCVVLVRQDLNFSGGTRFKMLYGANAGTGPTQFGNRTPTMTATIFNNGGSSQFLDGYKFRFVDDLNDPISQREGAEKGDTINYQAVLINSLSTTGYFRMNHTQTTADSITRSRGRSSITLTEVKG
jgi:hypothetical protein|tara:strand:+ start:520 stop:1308 length:789 start_codon:yes stop_codon:yes gene_type:complete